MRELFFKNSFFRFYASQNSRRVSYKNNGFIPNVISGVALAYCLMFTSAIAMNFIAEGLAMTAMLLFIYGFSCGVKLGATPNVSFLLPISHRKKIAWYLLTPLFTIGLVAAIIALVSLLFYAIIGFVRLAHGINFFIDLTEVIAANKVGGLGGAFGAVYVLICYSMGIIVGLIKRKLYRNLTLVVFILSNYALFDGLLWREVYLGDITACSPFIAETYRVMPYLWVLVPVCGGVAAGLFGLAVFMTYRRFSPKKY